MLAVPERSAILCVEPLPATLAARIEGRYRTLPLPQEADLRPAFLAEFANDITVMVTSSKSTVGVDLMAALPQLAAVVNFGVGVDHIDAAEAARRKIAISNTPDVLTGCVADAAVGLMIDVMRGLSAADRFVRAGHWTRQSSFPPTRRVTGARVGILGLGSIGGAIADRLTGFSCEISYCNRKAVDGVTYDYYDSPQSLADAVDVLFVATPGGDETRALVSRDVLTALGPSGVLINIARGSVVDQDALTELLRGGSLGGAGLDVFRGEPDVPQALKELDSVVLLPHLASATQETRAEMEVLVLRNIESFLTRGTLVTPICGATGT